MILVKEFSPGSNGRMTTIGVYLRDLLLGQYYFDTLLPRIPVPVLRTVVTNLENMKLPTKHCGVTGDSTRGSEETSRRPPSVKASLSVSFGQRAPHRASTRDSSPVRRTLPPSSYDRENNSRQSTSCRRSQSRDLSDREYIDKDRGRDRDRDRSHDKDGDSYQERGRHRDGDWHRERNGERGRDRRYDYDRRSRDSYRRECDNRSSRDDRYHREGSYRRSRSRSRSKSRSRIDSMNEPSGRNQRHPSPAEDGNKEKTSASSNLATLRDLYGDFNSQKASNDKGPSKPSGTEEVIKLGGSTWR